MLSARHVDFPHLRKMPKSDTGRGHKDTTFDREDHLLLHECCCFLEETTPEREHRLIDFSSRLHEEVLTQSFEPQWERFWV